MKYSVTLMLVVMLSCPLFGQTVQEVSPIEPQTGNFQVSWDVTPSDSPMDGVVALSNVENAAAWGDLSVIVRCKPDGYFDARNGGDYAVDAILNYEAGQTYHVRISVDMTAQTYSVSVAPQGGPETIIATDYAFRVPADALSYRCIFINENEQWGGVPGALLEVDNFTIMPLLGDKRPCPFGTEAVRHDAPCDTAEAYWDFMTDSPVLHEYTAYQGTVVVDGDSNDAHWAAIPWTAMDVYDNLAEDVPTAFMGWKEYDENWEGPDDYSGWFKMLWDPKAGVWYFLFKEYDDVMMASGEEFTDIYAEDVQEVNQWQGDTWEIECYPYQIPGPDWTMDHIGNPFWVDGEMRYKPLSLKDPQEPLELADGDAVTSFEDTDGKAIFFQRNEDTGLNVWELAIQLMPGMESDSVWYLGMARTEADEELAEGKNRVANFFWGAGKRTSADIWSTILFSSQSVPVTHVKRVSPASAPVRFELGANYPNPFNPQTRLPFYLPSSRNVNISVFNVMGQKVRTLVSGFYPAGGYETVWDGRNQNGRDVTGGVYFIRMTAGSQSVTTKALLVR